MALLFLDSCDHYTTVTQKWSGVNNGPSIGANGKGGTSALNMSNSEYVYKNLSPSSASTFVAGLHFYWPSPGLSGDSGTVMSFAESGTFHLGVNLLSTGAISVGRNATFSSLGTILGTSAAGLWVLDTWYHLEFKGTIHDTTGSYEVRLNGVSVLSGSGVDTRNAGTGVWNQFYVGCYPAGADARYDNIYCLDQSGSAPFNDFLGDVNITARYGTADGNSQDSTPSTGLDRFEMVNDSAPDGDTTYTAFTALNQKDTYVMQDSPVAGVGTIIGYQTVLYAEKTDAGAGSICPVIRSGGTDYDGTSVALSNGSYAYVLQPYETNPATGVQMTEAEFDALEFGAKRTA